MAEDFGKKIGAFGQNVWKKAQGAVDSVGMSTELGAKTRELNQLYEQIGREYCLNHEESARQELPELFEKAQELRGQIDQIQEELQLRKGMRKCAACGAIIPVTSAFCSSCGAAMPKPEPVQPQEAQEPEERICASCGAKLEKGDLFCTTCGAKQE